LLGYFEAEQKNYDFHLGKGFLRFQGELLCQVPLAFYSPKKHKESEVTALETLPYTIGLGKVSIPNLFVERCDLSPAMLIPY
jgi:hypothetical protein